MSGAPSRFALQQHIREIEKGHQAAMLQVAETFRALRRSWAKDVKPTADLFRRLAELEEEHVKLDERIAALSLEVGDLRRRVSE